jgi:hypothetical protein
MEKPRPYVVPVTGMTAGYLLRRRYSRIAIILPSPSLITEPAKPVDII